MAFNVGRELIEYMHGFLSQSCLIMKASLFKHLKYMTKVKGMSTFWTGNNNVGPCSSLCEAVLGVFCSNLNRSRHSESFSLWLVSRKRFCASSHGGSGSVFRSIEMRFERSGQYDIVSDNLKRNCLRVIIIIKLK